MKVIYKSIHRESIHNQIGEARNLAIKEGKEIEKILLTNDEMDRLKLELANDISIFVHRRFMPDSFFVYGIRVECE